ncbi:hypothetical protein P691DRAFT_660368, partial [Macrolepiota fuliginosa MF-IS2]
PKERRSRTAAHAPSVKIHKRTFAVQDDAVEHIEIGAAAQASGDEILAALSAPTPQEAPTKKEKQALKRETFLHKIGALKTPYSKSHTRREKRKVKEQLAGGGLNDIQTILSTIAADEGDEDQTGSNPQEQQTKFKPQQKATKIGEGKNMPLSKNQRKRALQMEQFRQPLIRSTPEFTKNPFQTIRTHAQNTLVKHQQPPSSNRSP